MWGFKGPPNGVCERCGQKDTSVHSVTGQPIPHFTLTKIGWACQECVKAMRDEYDLTQLERVDNVTALIQRAKHRMRAMDAIKYDDFAKIELKVGTILDAQPHPDADKLVVLQVDLGSEKRQIVAGIRKFYTCEQLKGVQIIVVTNLEPRTLRGVTSHGMLLAASDTEAPELGLAASLALLTVAPNLVRPGSKVG